MTLRLAELDGVEPIDEERQLLPDPSRIEAIAADLVEVARIKTLDDVGEGHAAVARLRRWLAASALEEVRRLAQPPRPFDYCELMPTDPVRLELYAHLLDAVSACQDEAIRIEFHPVEVPADLRDDESPPIPPDAVRALQRIEDIVRRIELAAPTRVVRLAGGLSLEATQTIAHAVDRPRRERGEQLRELWSGVEGAPRLPTDSEVGDQVAKRFADAREAFVRAARADLGVSDDVLP